MSLVTLVSGGLDSSLMSILAAEEGLKIHPLFINYGQLCVDREWAACLRVHKEFDLPKPVQMDVRGFGKVVPSGLTNSKLRINEDAFLPGRNIIFLLLGASYAFKVGAKGVAIGLLTEKNKIFPDQTINVIKKCEQLISASMGKKIKIHYPLMNFEKRDVMKIAKSKGLENTYSCHSGTKKPCGKCISCLEFINAKRRS